MVIKGKVAEIIDNRTLALNVGSSNNVEPDMIFQILDGTGKIIKDPETGNQLGSLKLPKIQVKVTYVDINFSIAETFHYKTVNIGGVNAFGNISDFMSPPKYVKKYDTFEIEEELKKEIDKEKSTVKIGDLAESLEFTESVE